MFNEMAATLNFQNHGLLPKQDNPPTLKDMINSGSILQEMYCKKENQIEESQIKYQQDFARAFREKQLELHQEIAQEIQTNPEDVRISSKEGGGDGAVTGVIVNNMGNEEFAMDDPIANISNTGATGLTFRQRLM